VKPKSALLGLVAVAALATHAEAKTLSKIGVSVGSLGNPFFTAIARGVESEAKKFNPKVSVTVTASEYDLAKQQQQIESFVAAGIDFIVLDAVDPKALRASIKRAQEVGIFVVGVDEEADGEDATFMTDNVKAGEESCQFIVDRLHGKGDVVVVNGPQVSSVVARIQGCKQALSGSPGIRILSDNQDGKGSRDGGLAVMQSLLVRYSKIDAVVAINDPSAIGASLALRQSNRPDIFIASVDGSPDIEVAIKDPATKVLASSSQDPFIMATSAVRAGVDLMAGKKIATVKTLIPPTLITKDNVESYITKDNVESYKGWSAPRD
jgi:ribose transport system substrate-binding protein